MSYFFTPFPVVLYDLSGNNRPSLATDITRRFKLSESVKQAGMIYYDYDIKDHDRPDTMAKKYYGDPSLDWLFFVVNEIYDPYFQWPLTQNQFDRYIRQKYGNMSDAQEMVHHYEQIVTPRKEFVSTESEPMVIPERSLIVDYQTYTTLPAGSRRIVTNYEYEMNLNESRRSIKILDKAFVPEIMQSLEGIFK